MVRSQTFALNNETIEAILFASYRLKVSRSEIVRLAINQAREAHPEIFQPVKKGAAK